MQYQFVFKQLSYSHCLLCFLKEKKEKKNNFLWSTSSYSSALPQGISTGMQGFPFVLSCTSHKTGVGFSEIKHCNKSPRLNFK